MNVHFPGQSNRFLQEAHGLFQTFRLVKQSAIVAEEEKVGKGLGLSPTRPDPNLSRFARPLISLLLLTEGLEQAKIHIVLAQSNRKAIKTLRTYDETKAPLIHHQFLALTPSTTNTQLLNTHPTSLGSA